ncbi:hypothetical protein OS493_016047 [Desmophyllum pertusum]|uniref:Uncharacterized protein n=1 Tax=Desmophyllum pertusum TaxID=174260 RepID=A0A9X0A2A4_9CNID|nr:hypothetical protein OS493_016047 [Desmophyllum pertusum]
MWTGVIRGIRCSSSMQRRIMDTVQHEFSEFLPKVETSHYRVKFIPLVFPQTYREKSQGLSKTYVNDTYVIEISVKAGKTGEVYESSKHQVFIRRESSVQGPLNPLQIKDIVIAKYREGD